ncbi:MAG: hypothetical protein A07HB70_01385 [uncultured archaeon A07HB70]|nr:MAG: hypothetical protein A07HB70_01385 [uncultured archaeon A07HB70]
MSPGASSPVERDTLLTVGGTLLLFAVLVGATEATVRSFAPILGLFGGMLAYEVADDLYDLPDGTNWTVYGLGIGFAGVVFALNHVVWAGGLLVVTGAWFVVDGATRIRYGSVQTVHEFVSGLEDDAMLKMQVMNTVYRTLRGSDDPLTVAELAECCDLTESRVGSALDYMEHRGQVISTGAGYRAKPQRWGKATPVARALRWVPRRVVRPVTRVRRHG